MKLQATLLADFYKLHHIQQYPEGTKGLYSTWTPRTSRIEGVDEVLAFGFQGFIKKYLIDYFNKNFFERDIKEIKDEYKKMAELCILCPRIDHIEELHELGYLPIRIKAVEEGTFVPIKVPMFTIESTHPRFFWLTNFLETLISCETWQSITSATIAYQYKKILTKYELETRNTIEPCVSLNQAHDFSMRGMSSLETVALSGAGHLLSFQSTDSIPAVHYLNQYYGYIPRQQIAIPGTEHSVMCSYGEENEFETFRHLILDVYRGQIASIVSDTWNIWRVLTEYLPKMKEDIIKANSCVIIRPDSGDPVKILLGDESSDDENVRKGVVELLWDTFGGTINEKGYKCLDCHIGVVYGDAITLERAKIICEGLKKKGFESTTVTLGVGSFSYQMNTRDTFGFALKATWLKDKDSNERFLFKNPITDNGVKKSQKGRVVVLKTSEKLIMIDGLTEKEEDKYSELNQLKTVFENGKLIRETNYKEIVDRINNR